ncbi:MAG: hypothetical protein PHX45_00115 [Acidobacteriota bacterium]|nr:hypothetical protein [Acidobacteriota bacterium]
MNISFFGIAIPVGLTVLGYLVGFWMQKWKATEARRIDIEKQRRPIYADAVKLIFAIEKNRGDTDRFEAEINKMADWIPVNASYLPPKGINLIFGVANRGKAYSCDLHNGDTNLETRKWFLEILQAAKEFFLGNQDIRWLPEDREHKK